MNARTGSVPHDLAGSLSPDQYKRWQENRKKPMRNLEQYPITTDEIIQCLKVLMDDVAYEKTGLVGDMRPLLLANAIRIILDKTEGGGLGG